MQEIWKDIIHYEGIYQISSLGNVRRIKKDGTFNYLKPSNRLYQDVDLSKECEHKRHAIHRLVALHFVPNPNPLELTEVNHKDGNKHNNKVENLEWVSLHENVIHSYKVLGHKPFGKAPKPVNKIDIETNEIIETFESVSSASKTIRSDCSRSAIINCCKGKSKTAYGFKWQYAE